MSGLVGSPTGKRLVSSGDDTTRVWGVAVAAEVNGVFRQERGIGHDNAIGSRRSGFEVQRMPG